MLIMGGEFSAPNVAEHDHVSKCHYREAEAPVGR